MHPRDRLKRNSKNKFINTKSKELKGKLAKKPLTHPRERVKRKKETAKKNLELENLDIETFKNQNIFDVNISFEKEKKQRGKI